MWRIQDPSCKFFVRKQRTLSWGPRIIDWWYPRTFCIQRLGRDHLSPYSTQTTKICFTNTQSAHALVLITGSSLCISVLGKFSQWAVLTFSLIKLLSDQKAVKHNFERKKLILHCDTMYVCVCSWNNIFTKRLLSLQCMLHAGIFYSVFFLL